MSQARKQEIANQIEQLQKQIDSGVSMHAADTNRQQIAAMESELAQIEETEAREQKTEVLLDEYNDTLVNIFSTLFPEEKYKVLLGVNEYENLRQDYKRVHKAFHAGQIEKINADHVAELNRVDENWREKFGRLTAQAQATENQLAEQKAINEKKETEWAAREEKFETEIREKELLLNQTQTLLNLANERIAELEAKLEQANKPKEPAQNESLNNVLNEIKSRKQDDPDAILQRFMARQQSGPKVMAIEHGANKIELPEYPFRPEVAPPVLEQSADPLPTLVTEQQFPNGSGILEHSTTDTTYGEGTTAESGSSSNDAPISRTELEARFKRIENQLGLISWKYESEDVA